MGLLPTELVDIVIDFHHSDRKTLAICSLVCRSWLPASRFHLNRTVRIKPLNVRPFVELLDSPSSTIANYVHTLEIWLRDRSAWRWCNGPDIPIFDVIAPYFHKFVAAKSISILGERWVPVSEEFLSRDIGRIADMELTDILYDPYFPKFGLTFKLGDGSCGPFTFTSALNVLRDVPTHDMRTWLPILAQLPSVSQIDIRNIRDSHLPTVQAMLNSGGHSIHVIKLRAIAGYPALSNDCIDLTHNTNLRQLSIGQFSLRDAQRIADDGYISKIIQRIPSHCMTYIHIRIWTYGCVDLTWLGCKKMAEELNHPRFSELEKVWIDIAGLSGQSDAREAWVHREMSSLSDRNITLMVTTY